MRIVLNTISSKSLGVRRVLLLACCFLLLAGCASRAPTRPDATDAVATPVSPPMQQPAPVRAAARLGLSLGGGAARGFAHVGVIQVLEEAGIRPDLVVGTSAGSLVAALYASGKSAAQLHQVAQSMEEATFADWSLATLARGALRGEALARYVNEQVAGRSIEALPLPLGIVATDLHSGQGMLFQRGDTGKAVRASSSVPALFQPVKIAGRDYVDGGLVSPVPVRYARQMGADLVLAVDISSAPEGNPADGLLQIVLQTFAIMSKSINNLELLGADLVVRPALNGVKSGDFAARQRSIEAGRTAMLAALPQLKKLIAAHNEAGL